MDALLSAQAGRATAVGDSGSELTDGAAAEHGPGPVSDLGAVLTAVRSRSLLKDELPPFLEALLELDDEPARSLVQVWQSYLLSADVSGTDPSLADSYPVASYPAGSYPVASYPVDLSQAAVLSPALRIAVYHLLLGDLEGVRHAVRFARWAAVVEVPVERYDGRHLWACEHVGAGPAFQGLDATWWLDVTSMGIVGAPIEQLRPCHVLRTLRAHGSRFKATGTTHDAFHLLASARDVRLSLVADSGRTWCSVPVQVSGGEPYTWSADAPWRWQVAPQVDARIRGTLQLEVTVDGRSNRMSVRMPTARAPRIPISLGHGVAVRLVPGPGGSLIWKVSRAGRGWHAWRQRTGLLGSMVRLVHGRALILASWLARHLPARAIVTFEAAQGRSFSGHPRAISEALAQERPRLRQVWSYLDEPERFPGWAVALRQGTLRHRWVQSRARWWVSDDLPRQVIRKQARNRFLQTWRGQPIACVGTAELDAPMTRRKERRPPAWQVRRWDLLLSPSQYFAEHVVPALGFTGDLVGPASPFGAAVLGQSEDSDLRRRLGLPVDRRIVLLATAKGRAWDLRELVAAIGTRAFLLLIRDSGEPIRDGQWAHGINRGYAIDPADAIDPAYAIDPACSFAIRDVTGSDELAGYLASADLMVTDGSAWTLDFARLGRPVILWGPGYQELRRVQGTFLDLPSRIPGPTVGGQRELIAALTQWLGATAIGPADWRERARELAVLAGPADPVSAHRCGEELITGRTARPEAR